MHCLLAKVFLITEVLHGEQIVAPWESLWFITSHSVVATKKCKYSHKNWPGMSSNSITSSCWTSRVVQSHMI